MRKTTWLGGLLAAGLAMMGAGVAAAAPGDGPVPATGDLVIHKFIGAPIAGERTGEAIDTSGWTGVTAANGVVFDLYQVGPPVAVAPPGEAWADVPPQGEYLRNATTKNLEVYDGTTLIGEYALTDAATPRLTTASDGTATASALPQGLYLAVENAAASTTITDASTGQELYISQVAAPFVVAVPMTTPDGTGWLDVVHVYPKNEALTVGKTVDAAGAIAVGDTVTYTITVSVPSDIADSKKFAITDPLNAALDLTLASVTVDTLPALTPSLVKDTDYTIAYDPATHVLAVTFDDTGRAKLAAAGSVVVTLGTTVNASVLSAPGMSVTNTAHVDFTNASDVDFEANSGGGDGEDVPAMIHTAAISVTKVDASGAALNGATFKIASSSANAKAGTFLRIDPDTKVVYDVDPADDSAWTKLGSANDYAINPANVASFTGLRDQVVVNGAPVWQTYWVAETAAPASYNLLAEPIAVSFADAFAGFADPADYDHVASLTVKNSKGFLLPQTGGAGTVLLTVAGVVLIGSAVLVGASRKKKTATV